MDGSGGRWCCCFMEMYNNNNHYLQHNHREYAGEVDRIMLRYRPIAPKPAPPSSVHHEETNSTITSSSTGLRSGNHRRRGKKRGAPSSIEEVVTTNNSYDTNSRVGDLVHDRFSRSRKTRDLIKILCNSTSSIDVGLFSTPVDLPAKFERPSTSTAAMKPEGSMVVVDCVAASGGDHEVPWRLLCSCTDVEARRWLKGLATPAFISEGFERVVWVNLSYGKMVGGGGGGGGVGGEEEGMVMEMRKSSKAVVVPASEKAFTCRVKLKYASWKDKGSLTVPCDVWRLVDGGLAWKVDIDAALSLGR